MALPILYKKTKTGAVQQYRVWTIGRTIFVEQGQVEGKKQTYDTICFAKNLGKTNETSDSEQARLEAQSKWNKKVKSGYTQDITGNIVVNLPMKVKVLQDQEKNVVYDCISNEKLNGVNGTYKLKGKTLTLESRGGDLYPIIPHHTLDILTIMEHIGTNELNGELYIHGEHLQDITSAVKKPNKLSPRLEFHIFDICTTDTYKARREAMMEEDNTYNYDYIGFITGVTCRNREEIEKHFNKCIEEGFEGTVVKNLTGLYKHNIRSSDQFKYKKAKDIEKQIIGFNIDKNGHCVFVVKVNTNSDLTFKVKMKGTNKERLEIAKNATNYIGKWLNISYEAFSKDGKCLKPVGNYFRKMLTENQAAE